MASIDKYIGKYEILKGVSVAACLLNVIGTQINVVINLAIVTVLQLTDFRLIYC